MIPEILNTPSYLLHQKSKQKRIEVQWIKNNKTRKFVLSADPNIQNMSLPLITHYRYLNAMLALFDRNYSEDGYLRFSASDIDAVIPKHVVYSTIRETLRRYHGNIAEFHDSWGKTAKSETFRYINKYKVDNYGYTVQFGGPIVEAIRLKHRRFLPLDAFKKLSARAFAVYCYYYSYPDLIPPKNQVTPQKNSVPIPMTADERKAALAVKYAAYTPFVVKRTLRDIFEQFHFAPCHPKEVKDWITAVLNELVSHGFIHPVVWHSEDTFSVHCVNYRLRVIPGGKAPKAGTPLKSGGDVVTEMMRRGMLYR